MASLKTMAADTANPDVKKTDLFRVDPRVIEEEPGFNLRDYDSPEVRAHIRKLADAIKAGEYIPPVLVRVEGEVIKMIDGHCRRLGALLAIEEGADVGYLGAIEFKGNDAKRVEVMLQSGEGLPFSLLEHAKGYLRLANLHYTNGEIAEKMKRTPARVEQMLLLARANTDVHLLVKSGAVSADTAIEAVRKHGDQAGAVLADALEQVKKEGKSKVTKSAMRPKSLPPKVVTTVVESIDKLFDGLDKQTRRELAELETMDPSRLKGRTIELDATAVLALLQAKHGVEDVRERRRQVEANAGEAGKQQSLDMEGQNEEAK